MMFPINVKPAWASAALLGLGLLSSGSLAQDARSTRQGMTCVDGQPSARGAGVHSSQVQNLGAMVSKTRDLCAGRTLGPAPADPQLRALQLLRQGPADGRVGTADPSKTQVSPSLSIANGQPR